MIFFLVKDKAASIPFYLHTSSPSGLLSPIPVAPALFVNPQGLQTARYFYIIILYVMGSLDRYGVAIHHGNIDFSGKMNRKKKGNGCGYVYVWSHELAGPWIWKS
jgi:hypothetical protein